MMGDYSTCRQRAISVEGGFPFAIRKKDAAQLYQAVLDPLSAGENYERAN
jgi:hypothetical protein